MNRESFEAVVSSVQNLGDVVKAVGNLNDSQAASVVALASLGVLTGALQIDAANGSLDGMDDEAQESAYRSSLSRIRAATDAFLSEDEKFINESAFEQVSRALDILGVGVNIQR